MVQILATAAAYFAAAAGAMALTRFDGGVAMLWPACGLLAGVLGPLPTRRWPPILLACGGGLLIAVTLFGFAPAAAPLLVPVNLGEAVLIVGAIRAIERRWPALGHLGRFAGFVGVAGIVAPALSALAGGLVAHVYTGKPFIILATDWFAAHALGTLFVLPIMSGMRDVPGWSARTRKVRWLRGVGLLGALALVAAGVFWQSSYPLLILPVLPLTAIAFLVGTPGVAAGMLLLAIVGGFGTAMGLGPLALMHGTPGLHAQFFQLYLAMAGLIAFPMAAEISRRSALVMELRRSEAGYRLLADRVGDVILRLTVDGTIDYASPSIATVGGIAVDEAVGRQAQSLVVPEDRGGVIAAHLAAVSDPSRTAVVEYRYRRPDGRLVWLETHTRAYCGEDGQVAGVVSAIRDVSQRKATESELLWEATTDPLTGIGNRRAFDRALARAHAASAEGGRGGCVAIFDIDHFKRVNDTHGHDAGDAVIRALADTLRRSLREGDFAARLGGEEFGLILAGADEEQARRVCERVRRAFTATPVVHAGGVIACKSVSAGICALHRATDPAALVRLADDALYRAKRGGRDRLEIAA